MGLLSYSSSQVVDALLWGDQYNANWRISRENDLRISSPVGALTNKVGWCKCE